MARGSTDYQKMQAEAALEQSIVNEIHLGERTDEAAAGSADDAGGQDCDEETN